MTGDSTGSSGREYDKELFLSPVMDLRTEPNVMKEPLLGLDGALFATAAAVDCLPGPKGNKLRSARKAGIPDPEMFPAVVIEVEAGVELERAGGLSGGKEGVNPGRALRTARGEITGMWERRGGGCATLTFACGIATNRVPR